MQHFYQNIDENWFTYPSLYQNIVKLSKDGYILDGFPRTIDQAKYLDKYIKESDNKLISPINIILDKEIAIRKLLGRRNCKTCGESFNIAHIVEGMYDMPAILPNKEKCILGDKCDINLETRNDDNNTRRPSKRRVG